MNAVKPKNLKINNSKAIINTMRQRDNQSIKDISDNIKLSSTAISRMLGKMVEKGLVECSGKGESSDEGGKRPTLFSIHSDYKFGMVILVELDGIYSCIYDLMLTQRHMESEKGPLTTYEECLERISRMIELSLNKVNLVEDDLCGIIIGFPGIVDFGKGEIIYPICSPEWKNNLKLCQELEKRLDLSIPIYLENSGRLAGYSELLNSPESRDETIVSLGHDSRVNSNLSGAGGSVMINGELVRGKGAIGEFGHMMVDPSDTVVCRCGRCGCFESTTSIQRLLEHAKRQIPSHPESALYAYANQKISANQIFAAVNEGDKFARDLIEPIIKNFTIVIDNLILTYEPDQISIFGIYSAAGDYFIAKLREWVSKYFSFTHLRIEYNTMDYLDMEKRGGALFLFDHFFDQDELYN